MSIYLNSSNISLTSCSIIVSIDLFHQVPLSWKPSHNVQIPVFTFCRFLYRNLTCLAPKWCCTFYFSGIFVTGLTIITLLRKSNFSIVCKTLLLDILIDLVSWKLAHVLKLVNARAAAIMNLWLAMSCLIKYFIAKYVLVKQNPRTPLNWHKCGLWVHHTSSRAVLPHL